MTQNRPSIDSVSEVTEPFPVYLKGKVVKGFGRGSKDLNIPTANYPSEVIKEQFLNKLDLGIYYGYSKVSGVKEGVLPMVMSVGWNPFYNNTEKSAEVHIIHNFEDDFYGHELSTVVLGYVRAEKSYESLDALIADIKFDIQFALNSLELPLFKPYLEDKFFKD